MVAILDEVACRICGVEYDRCEMSLTYLESIKDCFGVFVSVKKTGQYIVAWGLGPILFWIKRDCTI